MRETIDRIVESAIVAVSPEKFLPACVSIRDQVLSVKEARFDLTRYKKIYLVSFGKAAIRMALACDQIFSGRIESGIIIAKHRPETANLPEKFRLFIGGHPVPTEGSIAAAREVFAFLEGTSADDLVLFLISGGGSALLSLPQEGIRFADWQAFTRTILGCGADIHEFNILRKHLDRVKGGGLALAAAPSECISLILSDVVGNRIDSIASGPTASDPSTFQDAWNIVERYQLAQTLPKSVLSVIQRGMAGEIPETLKADNALCQRLHYCIAADNRAAALATAEKAREMGLNPVVLSCAITGEAREVGKALGGFFAEMDHPHGFIQRPALLILGGETTVTLRGDGLGGRNLELALGAVQSAAEYRDIAFVTLATDGEDGPTNAAGAIVSESTWKRGLALGMKPDDFLRRNDSFHYFERLNDLIQIGSTGVNVNDLIFLFAF